jgi:GT2 family glycosyltransferase
MTPVPALSCIVSTYRNPQALRLCLRALASDVRACGTDAELIVGDDGDPEHQSRAPVQAAAGWGAFRSVRRVWQRHEGFGKCRIANKGAAGARAPLLLYIDGDCLVAPGAVAAHLRLSRPRRYVAGSALRLGPRASGSLDEEAVARFRHASPLWIAGQAVRGEVLSKAHYPWLRLATASLFRRTGSGGFNGGCTSLPQALLEDVNGWDETLGYGFEDTDLGHRLQNAGAEPVAARVEALVVHLWHERPYRGDAASFEANRQRVAASLGGDQVRARQGLAEAGAHDPASWEEIG